MDFLSIFPLAGEDAGEYVHPRDATVSETEVALLTWLWPSDEPPAGMATATSQPALDLAA